MINTHALLRTAMMDVQAANPSAAQGPITDEGIVGCMLPDEMATGGTSNDSR